MGYCTDAQKIAFITYMLEGEAEHWWRDARSLLQYRETDIT